MLRLWRIAEHELIKMEGLQLRSPVESLVFSPEGNIAASHCVTLWDIANQTPQQLEETTQGVLSVAYSPSGTILAAGTRHNTVRLYEIGTESVPITLRGHSGSIQKVTFSPNGNVLGSASLDGTVRLWNIGDAMQRDMLEPHSKAEVTRVAFSSDGRLLATGHSDGQVALWDANTGASSNVPLQLNCDSADPNPLSRGVTAITFSPDDATLAVERVDGSVQLWYRRSDRVKTIANEERADIGHFDHGALSYSSSGEILVGTKGNSVKLWNVTTTKELHTLRDHDNIVTAVALAPKQNLLVSGDNSGELRMWDLDVKRTERLSAHESTVWSIGFSNDGKIFATSSEDHSVKLWNTKTRKVLFSCQHTSRVFSVAFSPDGHTLASSSYDGSVKLWDTATGEERFSFVGHEKQSICSVAFSPDGRTLAGANGKVVLLWRCAPR
jgi:WD40 repeat protein